MARHGRLRSEKGCGPEPLGALGLGAEYLAVSAMRILARRNGIECPSCGRNVVPTELAEGAGARDAGGIPIGELVVASPTHVCPRCAALLSHVGASYLLSPPALTDSEEQFLARAYQDLVEALGGDAEVTGLELARLSPDGVRIKAWYGLRETARSTSADGFDVVGAYATLRAAVVGDRPAP